MTEGLTAVPTGARMAGLTAVPMAELTAVPMAELTAVPMVGLTAVPTAERMGEPQNGASEF
jgi:hypothetical protein